MKRVDRSDLLWVVTLGHLFTLAFGPNDGTTPCVVRKSPRSPLATAVVRVPAKPAAGSPSALL